MTNNSDNKFFPDYLPQHVSSQTELEDTFLKYPNLSKSYVWLATAYPEQRQIFEEEWPKVRKYLDKDFLQIIQTNESEYSARSWEFQLAIALINHNLPLREKTWREGPDFCIETINKKRIWIEAISCTLGTEDPVEPRPNLIAGQIYSHSGNIEDTNRPRALRITSAIGSKLEKYKNYLERGVVASHDHLLIAVNGNEIQHYSDPSMLFKYAIFGQGPDVLVRVEGEEKLKGGFYKPIATITKNSKGKSEEIPPHFMEMDEFSIINAIIYCGYTAGSSKLNGREVGYDFLFAYHTNPINPLPSDFFKFGRGIHKDPKLGTISDIQQGSKI